MPQTKLLIVFNPTFGIMLTCENSSYDVKRAHKLYPRY